MFCKECGTNLPEGTPFCTNCGAMVNDEKAKEIESPQTAAPVYVQQPHPKKKKKGKGCLIALISVVVVIALIIGALFLFLPGFLRASDLKVKHTESDYLSALDKLGYSKDESPDSGAGSDYSIQYGATHPLDTTLTSEEITAFLSFNRPPYYAMKNVQVKFNPDGTIEASGKLDLEYMLAEILRGKYSKDDIFGRFPMIKLLPNNLNFYLDFEGDVIENKTENIMVHSVKIQGISLPGSIVKSDDAINFIEDFTDEYIERMNSKSGIYFEHLGNEDGELTFIGIMPDSVERFPAK